MLVLDANILIRAVLGKKSRWTYREFKCGPPVPLSSRLARQIPYHPI